MKVIWEVGSRDGEDGIALLRAFPESVVHCFEPNPNTFPKVRNCADQSGGCLVPHSIALCNEDAAVTFFCIDQELTVTPWEDGNPGASSLFEASGNYDHVERYVQTAITVEGSRGDSLINSEQVPRPNLIWMDVQGAELLVLKWLEEYLPSVDAIFLELSLKEIYRGQALAPEVVDILKRNFYWHSVYRHGPWQFDALFVSRRIKNSGLSMRDALFRWSLKTHLKIGIARPLHAGRIFRNLARRVFACILDGASKFDSAALGKFALTSTLLAANAVGRVPPYRIRQLVSTLQPIDPVVPESEVPAIEVIIPVHPKDDRNLPLVLQGVREGSVNPIGQVFLVTPDSEKQALQIRFPQCSVLGDREVLGDSLWNLVQNRVPHWRRSWIIQQIAKLLLSRASTARGCLVLDADTVLLRPRTWVNCDGVQLLSIANEYHWPYQDHVMKMWSDVRPVARFSFVTHHQLMQPVHVRKMFASEKSLAKWVALADWNDGSPVSEYQSYGAWIASKYPHLVRTARWANRALVPASLDGLHEPSGVTIGRLRNQWPYAYSVSFHSYLSSFHVSQF